MLNSIITNLMVIAMTLCEIREEISNKKRIMFKE